MQGPSGASDRTSARTPWPRANRIALGVAIAWLVVVTLACLASVGLIFTPEVDANAALVTFPLFASGWGSVAGATWARRREGEAVISAPIAGAGVGLALGILAIGLFYELLWPGYL